MTDLVEEARAWVGTPYVHGASVLGGGTDCLGLIRGLWRGRYGSEPEVIPTYSFDWSEPQGEEVLWAAARRVLQPVPEQASLRAGQVLLFRMRDRSVAKHLGILSNAGSAPKFIHAYSGRGVVESSLSRPWARRIVERFEFPSEE